MAVFFMFGKYSHDSLRNITAKRTQEAVGVIEKLDGQVTAMYAMLGPYDVILIVNLPGIGEAVEASIALGKLTGIAFMTCPALSVERFDHLIEIDLRKYMSQDK
jgi:uncharacterized protein with GYD domain